jgi:serine/threonine protein phosphatase PrpC
VRANNQDAMYADWGLFVVADGMGGHQGGEVAANLAVRAVAKAERGSVSDLRNAVVEANRLVHETAVAQPELHGMGTTLTALAVDQHGEGHQFVVLNVGDSRVYRYRDNQLEQLTEDHSYVAELVRRGEIDDEAASVHPYRNMLTRAIGVHPDVEIDEWLIEPAVGDRFVLCSDGLTNELDDSAIAEQLANTEDPGVIAKALVAAANEHGGRDNSTVLIVDVQAEPLTDNDELREVAEDNSVDFRHKEEEPLDASASATGETFEMQPRASTIKQRSWLYDQVRISLGAALITLVLTVTTAAMVITIGWYARSGYHVDVVANHVVIQKGRAGGLLWFEPTLEQWTQIQISELSDVDQSRLANSGHMSTLNEAQSFVATLQTRQFGGEDGS